MKEKGEREAERIFSMELGTVLSTCVGYIKCKSERKLVVFIIINA